MNVFVDQNEGFIGDELLLERLGMAGLQDDEVICRALSAILLHNAFDEKYIFVRAANACGWTLVNGDLNTGPFDRAHSVWCCGPLDKGDRGILESLGIRGDLFSPGSPAEAGGQSEGVRA